MSETTEGVELPAPDTDDGPEGVCWSEDDWGVHLDTAGWVAVSITDTYVNDPTKLARALLAADARRRPRRRAGGEAVSESDEPQLRTVQVQVCELCLQRQGDECHTPGCAFWLCSVDDIPAMFMAQVSR